MSESLRHARSSVSTRKSRLLFSVAARSIAICLIATTGCSDSREEPSDQNPKGPAILGSVVDVTPTLLALMGLPLGDDMDGRVLSSVVDEGFLSRRPLRSVATHDTEALRATRAALSPGAPGQNERLEQLRSLGYLDDLDDPEDDREKPPEPGLEPK
ncbi:MAG: hypothetical protein JRE71_05190 [Deltaproteobacteria bacterium]|nr:hypothetical protein [Deltaproteobacteria bacterium]